MAKRLTGRAFYLKMKRAKELKAQGKSKKRKPQRSKRFKKVLTHKTRVAVDRYTKFMGKNTATLSTMKIDLPGPGDKLVKLGGVPEIIYSSDKWSRPKTTTYRHPLKKHGVWLALIGKDGRVKTLIAAGLDLNITERGLLG